MLRVHPTPKYWSHSQSQLLVIVQIRNQFFIYYFSVYFSSLPFFAASLLTWYFACWCRHHFARSSRLRLPCCHCRRWCCFSFIFLHSKLSHANFVMHSYFAHIFFRHWLSFTWWSFGPIRIFFFVIVGKVGVYFPFPWASAQPNAAIGTDSLRHLFSQLVFSLLSSHTLAAWLSR